MESSSSNSDISLAIKCLELCSALKDKDCNFSFQLRLGSGFNFSLKSEKGVETKAKTRRSPSYLKRQHRRHQEFLQKKSVSDGTVAEKRHKQLDMGVTTAVPYSCKAFPCPKSSSNSMPFISGISIFEYIAFSYLIMTLMRWESVKICINYTV